MSKRGRPEIDDRENLEGIADLLAAGKARSRRNAIIEVVGTNDSTIRRLERKWRKGGSLYVEKAREKLEIRTSGTSANTPEGLSGGTLSGFTSSALLLTRFAESMRNSPFRQLEKAMRNSPVRQLEEAMRNSPFRQFEKAMRNSPFRQLEKAMRNSPAQLLAGSIRKS